MACSASPQRAISDLLNCAVCLEQFVDPRMLSCQHTFCGQCLVTVAKQRRALTCPSCRQETKLTEGGAQALPKNLVVNQLLDALVESQAADDAAHKCEECVDGNASSGFCTECHIHLCDDCIRYHSRRQQTTAHRVLTTAEFRERADRDPTFLRQRREPSCELHPTETLEFFCTTCRKCICHRCTIAKHQHCERRELRDVFEEKSAGVRRLLQELHTKRSTPLRVAVDENKKAVSLLSDSGEAAKTQIRQKFKDCRALLDAREAVLLRSVECSGATQTRFLTNEQSRLSADLQFVLQTVKLTTTFLDNNTMATIVTGVDEVEHRLKALITPGAFRATQRGWDLSPVKFSLADDGFGQAVDDLGQIEGGLSVAEVSTASQEKSNGRAAPVPQVKQHGRRQVIWLDPNVKNAENSEITRFLSENDEGIHVLATTDMEAALKAIDPSKDSSEQRIVTAGRGGEKFVQKVRKSKCLSKVLVFCSAVEYHETWAANFADVEVTNETMMMVDFARFKI